MQVGIFTYAKDGSRYGESRYVTNLKRHLAPLGCHVTILRPPFALPMVSPFLFSTTSWMRPMDEFDVVHSSESAGAFARHANLVFTFHHPGLMLQDVSGILNTGLHRLLAGRASAIVVPSRWSRDWIVSRFGKGIAPKIHVVPHGIDREMFSRSPAKVKRGQELRSELGLRGKRLVVNVGRIAKHKRQWDVPVALHGVPDVAVVFVGEGPGALVAKIRETARRNQVAVRFLADIPDADLAALYSVADLYLHTSLVEGFGFTILEAMSCGLPVLAYDVCGLKELIGPGGWVVPAGALPFLRTQVHRALEDAVLLEKVSKQGLEQAHLFDWPTSAQRHLEVYEGVFSS